LSWGSAIEVPGTAALNVAGNAGVNSVSCPSAGECAAGGDYATGLTADYLFTRQAFVVSEQGGVWGSAIVPPGLAALSVGGVATVSSVSCASAGNCAAGGTYWDAHPNNHAFVVSEKNGVWGTAIEVPGMAALNGAGDAEVSSVSCVSPGNCTAGGFVSGQAFVVSENNGTWGTAFVLETTAGHNDYDAEVASVSCGGVGDCVAGGYSTNSSGTAEHAFVADERNGTWGHRRILISGDFVQMTSVSCSSPGNCAAGGIDQPQAQDDIGGFVVDEKNGKWGEPMGVGGGGDFTNVNSVSCASPGNCVAGVISGSSNKYGDGYSQAYLVSEKNGRWGTSFVPPGVPPIDYDIFASVSSVSCASAGNCAATGLDENGAYVVAERNGVWDTADEIPGTAPPFGPYSEDPSSVSCASARNCAIGGSYGDGSGHAQAFVTAP
jgi:hypothetical protein